MRAFQKNIDALESKMETVFQKWKDVQEENQVLFEKNKKLEEALNLNRSDRRNENVKNFDSENDKKINLSNVETALDHYIKRIDACLELINIELNGK